VLAHHLPALQVVVPLIGAPLCALLPFTKLGGKLAWLFATLISLATFVIAILLAVHVNQIGVISYELGGWAPPWGIEYRIDHLSVYVLLIVSGIASVTMLAAQKLIKQKLDYFILRFYFALQVY